MFDMFNIQSRFTPELYERKGKRDLFITWDSVIGYAPESFTLREVSVTVAVADLVSSIGYAPSGFILQTYGQPLVASVSRGVSLDYAPQTFTLKEVVKNVGTYSSRSASINYEPSAFTLKVVVVSLNSYTYAATIGYAPASFVLA